MTRLSKEKPMQKSESTGTGERRKTKPGKKTERSSSTAVSSSKKKRSRQTQGKKKIAAHDRNGPKKETPSGSNRSATKNNKPASKNRSAAASGNDLRRPEKLKRSKRVPFDESLLGRTAPAGKSLSGERTDFSEVKRKHNREAFMRSSDGGADHRDETLEDWLDAIPIKRKPRSERRPTKRQLRKNRERARKRDLKRRKEADRTGREE